MINVSFLHTVSIQDDFGVNDYILMLQLLKEKSYTLCTRSEIPQNISFLENYSIIEFGHQDCLARQVYTMQHQKYLPFFSTINNI